MLAAGGAGLVLADLVDDLRRVPACTKYCYAATARFLGCDARDVGCVCKQSRNLIYYAEPCVTGVCVEDSAARKTTSRHPPTRPRRLSAPSLTRPRSPVSLDALQSVCTDAKASPPPPDADFSSASSVIALALDDQATANFSYSVHAGERTTIAGTTITSGSVVRTVVRKHLLASLRPRPPARILESACPPLSLDTTVLGSRPLGLVPRHSPAQKPTDSVRNSCH